jgi:hypothetical protein
VTRGARAWVVTLLALLVVPGVIGFDLWPLNGWRLFSLSRDARQTEYAIDVVDGGETTELDPERLPLAYRHVAWPLAELDGASAPRRRAVCVALRDAALDVVEGADGVALVREVRTMSVEGDDERITEDREVIERC